MIASHPICIKLRHKHGSDVKRERNDHSALMMMMQTKTFSITNQLDICELMNKRIYCLFLCSDHSASNIVACIHFTEAINLQSLTSKFISTRKVAVMNCSWWNVTLQLLMDEFRMYCCTCTCWNGDGGNRQIIVFLPASKLTSLGDVPHQSPYDFCLHQCMSWEKM